MFFAKAKGAIHELPLRNRLDYQQPERDQPIALKNLKIQPHPGDKSFNQHILLLRYALCSLPYALFASFSNSRRQRQP